MMLMSKITLRWDDVNDNNDIKVMYVGYVHGGAMTIMDIPGGRNIVIKEF